MQDEKSYNHIRSWLIPKLDAMGCSVELFANQVGVSKTMIYHYINDVSRPETQVMKRICDVLGVSLDEGLSQYTEKKRGRPRKRSGASARS